MFAYVGLPQNLKDLKDGDLVPSTSKAQVAVPLWNVSHVNDVQMPWTLHMTLSPSSPAGFEKNLLSKSRDSVNKTQNHSGRLWIHSGPNLQVFFLNDTEFVPKEPEI